MPGQLGSAQGRPGRCHCASGLTAALRHAAHGCCLDGGADSISTAVLQVVGEEEKKAGTVNVRTRDNHVSSSCTFSWRSAACLHECTAEQHCSCIGICM